MSRAGFLSGKLLQNLFFTIKCKHIINFLFDLLVVGKTLINVIEDCSVVANHDFLYVEVLPIVSTYV